MILVTGASGFIGARLVQRLARNCRRPVTALVHRLGTVGTARVAALSGVRLVAGDIRDSSIVDEAMHGCTAVVHCALDISSPLSVREAVTALGTRTVLEAARKNDVRHIIFLSTAAVHSWRAPGRWNEDAPVQGSDSYSRSKLAAEALLLRNTDVPVTVIRPTCVYGPFSRSWTVTPVTFLRLGVPLVSVDDGGRANLIYVDNLVEMILAALDRPADTHRIYLANEEEPASWDRLYSAYARTIGLPLLRYPVADSRWRVWREELSVSLSNGKALAGRVVSEMRAPLLRGLAAGHRHVPLLQRGDRFIPAGMLRRVAEAARGAGGGPVSAAPAAGQNGFRSFAPRELREFYNAKATFSAERARLELGWLPRIGAAEAIERTCDWIKFAGL